MAHKAKSKLRIEWGVATATLPGESRSGDLHLVQEFPGGILIAVMDGLGHGVDAAAAADKAASVLTKASQESVISLMKKCHEHLFKTRGVVMTLASLRSPVTSYTRDETMTWIGVGNVDARLFRASPDATPRVENILLRGGVVGYQLPSLNATMLSLTKGDLIVLATDGIGGEFSPEINHSDAPQQIADRILSRCAKETDDALVLVARYLGYAPSLETANVES